MSRAETWGSWRCALRIARRSGWRHRGRSALVLALLTVPVFAATLLVTAWENVGDIGDREVGFHLGRADLALSGEQLDRAVHTLPAGSRVLPLRVGRTVVAGPDGWVVQPYEAAPAGDPLTYGRYVPVTGRAPQGATEVAVTATAARQLRVRPGDQLTAGLPPRRLTVVGIIDLGRSLSESALLVDPGSPLSAGSQAQALVDLPTGTDWRPPPGDWNGLGFMLRAGNGPDAGEQALRAAAVAVVGGFAGAQVVLLVSAAFTMGARRQRRELALVAASGATARQVGRIVIAGGLLLGVLAGATGSILGLLTFALARDAVETVADHPLLAVAVPLWRIAAIAVVAVGTGLLAALLPARSAGRRPPRGVLSAVDARGRADLLWSAGGAVVAAVGVVAVSTSAHPDGRVELIAGGAVAGLLGVVACGPALIRFAARAATAMPLSWRLALRQAARHRLRTGAAIAAVASAVAGSVAVLLVGAAREAELPTGPAAQAPMSGHVQVLVPQAAATLLGPDGVRRVSTVLSATAPIPLAWVTDGSGPVRPGQPDGPRVLAVGDTTTLAVIVGRAASPAEAATLRDGGAVVFDPTAAAGDRTLLARPATGQALDVRSVVAVPGPGRSGLADALITPDTARRLGLPTGPAGLVIDPGRRPSTAELAAANAVLLAAQAAAATPPADPMVLTVAADPSPARSSGPMFLLLAAISGLVTLAASAVAVGLAGSELRGDLTTMVAAGATPRFRRRIAAAQAGVIVGSGAVLGTAVGLLPAAGYVGYNNAVDWHTPWVPLLLTVVVGPVLATALAGVASRAPADLTHRTT